MGKINKLFITTIVSLGLFLIPSNTVNANTTLSYKDVDGVKCVNIVELAKLKGEEVSDTSHEVYGKGYNINLDGKLITIYEEAPYIFVDGKMVVLKSEVISADGLEFNFPVMQTPAKEGDGFLIPMYVVEKSLGIKGNEDGIVIEKTEEENKEDTNTDNNNSNSGSNNSGNNGPSNSGSSNNGPSNNGNSGNNGNTESNGNSGNTNTTQKPEQSKPTGMAFSTFAGKLSSLGFDGDGNYFENGIQMGVIYATNSEASFMLKQNSSSFNSVVKNCLNMLLPNGGNKVYDIISNQFSNQTIEMDGRIVTIEQTSIGVGVKIKNK